jgi:hypothetical protein
MMTQNGKTLKIEEGTAGVPYIHHLQMQRACDRFLVSRGLMPPPEARKSAWLFSKKIRVR